MTDTATAAAESVAEVIDASEPQDNANAAELHEQAVAAAAAAETPEPEAEAGEVVEAETPEGETTETAEQSEAEKPAKTKAEHQRDAFQKRLNKEVAKRHDSERALEAAKLELEALRTPATETGETPAPKPGLTEAEIERRAAQIVEQRAYQASIQQTVQSGETEYGKAEFTEACNLLADMGANEKPEFLQIVTDTENGHKVLAHLGENPDEAERIIALPPLKMAAAIARVSMELGKPAKAAPVSAAPVPIKPLDGRARATPTPDKMDEAEFDKFFQNTMKKVRA